MRKKLLFSDRRNAMRFVVVQHMCHCLFSECQPDLATFLNDCLSACKILLNKSQWTFDEVSSLAEEVWRSFEIY